jgi:hypothetical protein
MARQPTRRSSFFFIGRIEPAELANFNISNAFLRDHLVLPGGCPGPAEWLHAESRADLRGSAQAHPRGHT